MSKIVYVLALLLFGSSVYMAVESKVDVAIFMLLAALFLLMCSNNIEKGYPL